MKTLLSHTILLMFILLFVADAGYSATIYKCTDNNGAVMFSDSACNDKKRVAVGITGKSGSGKSGSGMQFNSMDECRQWVIRMRLIGKMTCIRK